MRSRRTRCSAGMMMPRRRGVALVRAAKAWAGVRRPRARVRSYPVVVRAKAVELGLELGEGPGATLFGQSLLEGLVEALDLAAGLGVVGPGVLVVDAESEQLELDGAGAVAALGGEDGAVVGQ